eukprot:maker-scaffold337_size202799-snap-gene-1.18 protein:Tk05308 transcript:maker-scaffold337_size202799-snap-gene-1.18-mRNA-1 annotation:"hypothetical protein"
MAVHRPEITTAQPTRSSPTHSPRSSRGPTPRPQTLAQAAEDEAERLPSPMISGEASEHSSSPAQSQYNTPAHRWATPTPGSPMARRGARGFNIASGFSEAGGVILNLPSSGHTSVDGLKYSRIESSPLPMLMTSSEDQRRSRGLDSDSISGRTVSPLAWCGPHPRRILWALVLLLFVWSSFIFGCHLQKTILGLQSEVTSLRAEMGDLQFEYLQIQRQFSSHPRSSSLRASLRAESQGSLSRRARSPSMRLAPFQRTLLTQWRQSPKVSRPVPVSISASKPVSPASARPPFDKLSGLDW